MIEFVVFICYYMTCALNLISTFSLLSLGW